MPGRSAGLPCRTVLRAGASHVRLVFLGASKQAAFLFGGVLSTLGERNAVSDLKSNIALNKEYQKIYQTSLPLKGVHPGSAVIRASLGLLEPNGLSNYGSYVRCHVQTARKPSRGLLDTDLPQSSFKIRAERSILYFRNWTNSTCLSFFCQIITM